MAGGAEPGTGARLIDATGEPEWVTASTGLFGTRESFAPLYGTQPGDGELRLGVTKQLIKDAPNIDTDGHLDGSEIDTLYQHYAGHLNRSADAGTSAVSEGTGTELALAAGTSGPNTDDAMTRSEERLHVGTENVQAGRARLRKYVVTENVTQTVPVSYEEVRVEREPITDANRDAAVDGPAISEEEHEVTLNARAARDGEGSRAGRACPRRHRNRHRAGRGQRSGPQGADRRPRRGRRPEPRPARSSCPLAGPAVFWPRGFGDKRQRPGLPLRPRR